MDPLNTTKGHSPATYLIASIMLVFGFIGGANTAHALVLNLYHSPYLPASNIYVTPSLDKTAYAPGDPVYLNAYVWSDDQPQPPNAISLSTYGCINGSNCSANVFSSGTYTTYQMVAGFSSAPSKYLGTAPATSGTVYVVAGANTYASASGNLTLTVTVPASCGLYSGTDSLTPTCVYNLNAPITASGSSYTTTSVASPAGYTGSRTWNCSSGTWSPGSYTCTAPTPTASWSPSSITIAYGSTVPSISYSSTNATSCNIYNGANGAFIATVATSGSWPAGTFTGVYTTSSWGRTLNCYNSLGTASAAASLTVTVGAAASCTLPWGGSIASGASATAYQSSSVVSPGTCTSQLRTCTNGTLSGSYTNQSCVVTQPACPADTNPSTSDPATIANYCGACPAGQIEPSSLSCHSGNTPGWTAFGNSCSAPYCTGCGCTTPAPTATLTASPNPVAYNGRSTLTWSSTNATSCTTGGPWSNSGTLSGNGLTDPLTTNTTFTFQCTGPGGTSALQSVTVAVGASASCSLPWGGSIASGASATAYQSSSVVSPGTCTSQLRTCTNGTLSGSYTNQSCVVTQPAPTVTSSFTPSVILYTGSTQYSYSSTNATHCVVTHPDGTGTWDPADPSFGPATFYGSSNPGGFTTTVTCNNSAGTYVQTTKTLTVCASGQTIVGGVCTNPIPTATLTASPNPVAYNGRSTLTWSSTNATSCTTGGPWSNSGTLSGNGLTDPLTTNTTFTFQCTGPGGTSALQSVTVTEGAVASCTSTTISNCSLTGVASGGSSGSCSSGYSGSCNYSCSNGTWSIVSNSCTAIGVPIVTTSAVSSIGQTTAVSGGTVSSNGGATVTVSGIAWSTSSNPTTANSKTTDGWAIGGPWSDSISGLAAGTTYHVRAYATNSAGTAYGADVPFTTTAASCSNGANNPTACNTCSAPLVYDSTSLSCVTAPTATLTATPSSITVGQSSKLTWSSNATSCTGTGFSTGGAPSNSTGVSVSPSTTSTYQINCGSAWAQTTVTVNNPSINSFTVAPMKLRQGGGPVTIKWSTTDVTSCVVKKSGSTQTIGSGTSSTNTTDTVTGQTTYTLTCVGVPSSQSVTVNVVPGYQEF